MSSQDSIDKMMYSFVMEDVLKGLFIHVQPGYVACVYDLGRGVLKKVLTPGLHLKVPFWQKAKLFNTQTLEYDITGEFNPHHERALGDVPVPAVTHDGDKVEVEGTILLRLDMNIGEDFVEKIVRPTIRSRMRMVISEFNHDDIVGSKRQHVEAKLQKELESIFAERGIMVENVLLSEVSSHSSHVKH